MPTEDAETTAVRLGMDLFLTQRKTENCREKQRDLLTKSKRGKERIAI